MKRELVTYTSGDRVIGRSGDRKAGKASSRRLLQGLVLFTLSLVALVALTGAAWADDDDNPRGSGGGQQSDVARVSLIHGDVSMQRGDSEDWVAATMNTPMVRGDQLATGDKSRAELQLDYANVLRLSSNSDAKIADLTRTHIQVQLAHGFAGYSIFKGSEADVEIDTPNVAVHPLKRGRYRVQVLGDDETEVIVREGEAEVSTSDGSTTLKETKRMIIRGTAEQAEYKIDDAPSGDDWDHFNKDRDRAIKDAQSWGRTNSYYTGANDLDAYGRWVYVPGYGQVWQPYEQPVNWAPYQSGRWVYEPYWGWTWVSYEPWGWAPYHYGRWFFYGERWVWWPGPVVVGYRPVWSPAFVTFIGFGHNSGYAYGLGSIGWIPCGPGDYYYPWYGRGFNRVNVVNVTNVNVTNVNVVRMAPLGRGGQGFSNVRMAIDDPRVRRGISGVDVDHFGRGDAQVRRLDLKDSDMHDSRVMTGNLPVVPTRESLHAGTPVERMSGQPAQFDRFYSKRQPPAGPEKFHDQAARVEKVVQRENPGGQIPGAGQMRGPDGAQQGRNGDFGTKPNTIYRKDNQPSGGVSTGAQLPGSTPQEPVRTGEGRVIKPGGTDNGGNERGGWNRFGGRSRGNQEGEVNRQGSSGGPMQAGSSGAGSSVQRIDRSDRSQSGVTRASDSGSSDGGFHKFGGGRSQEQPDRSQSPNRAPDAGSSPSPSQDRGYSKFPSPGDRAPNQPDRSQSPANRGPDSNAAPRGNEDRGWQRFPAGGSPTPRADQSSGNSNDRSGQKPRLELDKPIVTPRQPDVRMDRRESSPSRQDVRPEPRSQPHSSPSPSRGAEMRGGGGGSSVPRGSSGGDRGGNRGGEGNRGGGGDGGKSPRGR